MMFRTLFGWRLWLALTLALGISQVGCDKLGFGDKKDSKSKKDKDKDNDDDDDDGKKKKKSDDEDKPAKSSSASSSDSGAPPTADTGAPPASGDSTGVPECDKYLAGYKKCIPGVKDDDVKKMGDTFRMAAGTPQGKEALVKSCTDSYETIKKVCPGKL